MYDLYRLDEAESYYREALSMAQELNEETSQRIIGVIHHNLGLVKKEPEKLKPQKMNF